MKNIFITAFPANRVAPDGEGPGSGPSQCASESHERAELYEATLEDLGRRSQRRTEILVLVQHDARVEQVVHLERRQQLEAADGGLPLQRHVQLVPTLQVFGPGRD